MKKLTAFLLAFTVTAPHAFAADNYEAYNKHIYNTVRPEAGVCDIAASFVGHEVEYPDVNDYFKGLISIINTDLNGDGSDELITVESKSISIYTVIDNQVTICGNIKEHLIGNDGNSYANVFLKSNNGVNYLGVEHFFANGVQNCYQLELFTLNGTEIESKAYIYQLTGNDELYQSVTKDGVSIFSHTNGNGIASTMDPNNYASVYTASKTVLADLGITDEFLNRADKLEYNADSYGKAHKLSD